MVLCINLVISYLISFPLMMGEGKDGRRLRLRPSFRLGESSSSERGASAPEGEPLARRGVDVLDLPPPPESSPTVGGGTIFWLNWGLTFHL
jgi:hypothetical protein